MTNKKKIGLLGCLLGAALLAGLCGAQGTNYIVEVRRWIKNSFIDNTPLGQNTPSTVNATSYALNGTAPSGHTLCGNGSTYVDSTSCTTQISGTLYWGGGSVGGPACTGTITGTLNGTPPSGSVVTHEIAAGTQINSPNLVLIITNISGSNVYGVICNYFTGTFSDGARTYNLKVL